VRVEVAAAPPRATALLKALEDVCATAVASGPWVLTVPIDAVLGVLEAHRALSAVVPGGAMSWIEPTARAGVTSTGEVWSFAGAGETACLVGSGAGRLAEVRSRAAELFASMVDACEVATPVPPPALFGGIAFRSGSQQREGDLDGPTEPWAPFGDARFVLPRWVYGRAGSRAFLRLALLRRPQSSELPAISDEARRVLEALSRAPASAPPPSGPSRVWMHEQPAAGWSAEVDAALASIRSGELGKVVASTRTSLVASAPFQVPEVLARLDAAQPACVRFAFTPATPPDSAAPPVTFLGATPERLVDKRGRLAQLDALAGTVRRDAADEGGSARRLLESDKDRREHGYVVDFLSETLRPVAMVAVAAAPSVRTLRDLHHLWTPVRATLAPSVHVLDLVERLHPTPAVCGVPREAALAWIDANERVARGWYAGAVGWFDAAGDGSFAVGIRSALLEGRRAWLHAGAGIVAGSTAAAEHAEVRLKQAATLAALGASSATDTSSSEPTRDKVRGPEAGARP
jgi:menaquinone-specific isochorismate synthase